MQINCFQDLLPFVERPSRYLGNEFNHIRKNPDQIKLDIALAFPDQYEIGTSHFGIQILYHILNQNPDIWAQRVFTPGADMVEYLKKHRLPLVSLESEKPLVQFDIVGFSLLYELNYTNVMLMLDLAGIPFYASQRDDRYPLIIAGGPCTVNPEPMADFFDAMVIGDGEQVILEMSYAYLEWKASDNRAKEDLLKAWAKLKGVYIPSFFDVSYNEKGFQQLRPKFDTYSQIKRAIVEDLDKVHFPTEPIVAYGNPVHDRLRLELARGCTRGCRFCQAGMIYRPVRERSISHLRKLARESIDHTGYQELSLLSLSTGDFSCIGTFMQELMEQYGSRHISISLPSVRAGTLTTELMSLIKKVRKTGFTIAPEAGSQRLRDVINKQISQDEIVQTVENAFSLGWSVIKLYFMIGLPTETEADLKELLDLVHNLRSIKSPKGRKGKLNVSVTTFIPKPHTPFQWERQLPTEESERIIFWFKQVLAKPGIQYKWQNQNLSLLEGLFARGDRRLSKLLVSAYNKGCQFDGWSDHFNMSAWQSAISEQNIDVGFYINRVRDEKEPLPWDHIDVGIDKPFLIKEKNIAHDLVKTPDCRFGDCQGCGVCDFVKIEPKVNTKINQACLSKEELKPEPSTENRLFEKYCIEFSKTGPAKYFAHLELVKIITRALNRAGIELKYSQGFHPAPKIAFQDALPIGIESHSEHFLCTAKPSLSLEEMAVHINRNLPKGLMVKQCKPAAGNLFKQSLPVTYLVTIKDRFFDQNKVESFKNIGDFQIDKKTSKGKSQHINLKDYVSGLTLIDPNRLKITLNPYSGKTLRPAVILRHYFEMSEAEVKCAKVEKLAGNE